MEGEVREQRAWCIARSSRPRKKELDEKRLWKKGTGYISDSAEKVFSEK